MGVQIKFEIDENNWKEVLRLISETTPKAAQNAFARSVKDGISEIFSAMQRNVDARVKDPTGTLARSLKIQRKKKYEPEFWHSSVAVYVGKKRKQKGGIS